MNDRPASGALGLLREFADSRTMELARLRLVCGLKFFDGNTLRPLFDKGEVKLALLLVLQANPSELLTSCERELLETRQQQASLISDEYLANIGRTFGEPAKKSKKRV